ncbi:MAG: MarR family transcriptional regulator [Defluviitaleaceae bacterium]|nr:MarR family transcriptional regulator [Defluviitaleaceae bacterium]
MEKDLKKGIGKFNTIYKKIDDIYVNYAKSLGMSNYVMLDILELLYNEDKLYTQKDFCELLNLKKQVVNIMVNDLRVKELVELKEGEDRRHKNITLTAEGKVFMGKVIETQKDIENGLLNILTSAEIATCVSVLEKYEKLLIKTLNL